jgi:hypothetical protein
MGNFCAEGVLGAGHPARLMIEEAQIVLHKAHQPHFLADLFDADVLGGKDRAQVDFAPPESVQGLNTSTRAARYSLVSRDTTVKPWC